MKVAIIYNKDTTGIINTFGMQNQEFYSEKTIQKVVSSIENAGHNVAVLDGNMYIIDRLNNFMPKVIEGEQMGMVFNMAYGIQGESRYTHIPSMLEMLGLPYIGSSPTGHALALDKVLSKIIWQSHNIPTPKYWVFNDAKQDLTNVQFPVIVKPKMESVSFGLKVVYNIDDLREAIHFIITEFQQQALVEQFIRGREFCVGLLGNTPLETFPILEIDLEGNPDAIQTVEDKKQHPKKRICPAQISEKISKLMIKYSIEAFNTLNLRDFARVDFRLDEEENIFILEINSMASLGATGTYPQAAKVAGYDFPKLINKILDVAAVRYFSNNLMTQLSDKKNEKLPLHSRLRAYLRSRQQNTENFLKTLVNINTHTRNIDGINQCSNLIKMELSQLGFSNEIYPQIEVGNLYYFSNSFDENIDFLILTSLDNLVKISNHENFNETEQQLSGTGIWENKGGIAVCISALQALKFAKLLRKIKIGIILTTETTINGKFSKNIINQKVEKAQYVLSLHGANNEGSIILSRSGSASYKLAVKLIDSSNASNVAYASQYFNKTLASIIDITKNDVENVIAPYEIKFFSNIFKIFAYGSAKISVRFNTLDKFKKIDQQIKKITTPTKLQKKLYQTIFDGGIKRPPMIKTQENDDLYEKIKSIANTIDIRISPEHRWSASDICNIHKILPKIDGLGPIGGYDNKESEKILRHSLIDRSLLLALLLNKK